MPDEPNLSSLSPYQYDLGRSIPDDIGGVRTNITYDTGPHVIKPTVEAGGSDAYYYDSDLTRAFSLDRLGYVTNMTYDAYPLALNPTEDADAADVPIVVEVPPRE